MKLVSLLGFCIMEINTQLSSTRIHAESIQPHHSKLRLISRIKLDYSPTPRPVHLDNRIDTLVVLRQFLEHEPAEIDWQILDLDQVCRESFLRSRWCSSSLLGHNYLWLLLNSLLVDLGNFLFFLFFQFLFLCCGSILQSSYLFICFFVGLALALALTFFLLQQLIFFLKELLAAYLFLSIIFLMTLPPSIIYHLLQTDTPI